MIVGLDPDVVTALNQPSMTALYALKLDLVSGVGRLHRLGGAGDRWGRFTTESVR